jgi:peptide/nickel transport system substrate-binding protein
MRAPRAVSGRNPRAARLRRSRRGVRLHAILGQVMQPVFRILGPLEVELGDRVVALGRRERALLGVLLLNAREVVSVEHLIDGVWGEVPPSSAKHMVHEYVSRLRAALGDASRIETRVPGYLAACTDEELDSRLFSQLTEEARAAAGAQDHEQALRCYDQALALWRGDALAGVELEGAAHIDAARLDEERRLVAEERVESSLALGRHRELIPELERRVRDAPLRERPRAQLMLALYRAGRQTDALERYREAGALLLERAGLEPGHELRRLERAILQQDPALELARPLRSGERPARVIHARRRRVRSVGASVALLAAAVVGALVFVLGHADSGHALARIDANSAGAIDPGGNRLVDQVPVQSGPGRIAAGFGSLWVVNDFDSTVSRIDPTSGTVEQTISVDGDPTAIAAGAGFVWVACTDTRSVNRIDPQTNRRVPRLRVGNGPSGIAFSPGRVWVTNRLDDTVTEIDTETGKVRATLPAGPSPSDITYGLGALWIANESSASVARLDPATGALRTFRVGNGPEAVAVGYGSIWTANSLDGTVSRIDPSSGVLTSFKVGLGPSSVLASDGAIWVADSYGGRVVRVDPRTESIIRLIHVGSWPQSLASLGGRIWLSAREASPAHRGGTLRALDVGAFDSLDRGVGYAPSAWSAFSVTSDGLVGFKRVGGVDGGTLVPDLATSLPEPTDSGRSYTFQLRRGIRYSNGVPVRASDLRRALERALSIGSYASDYRELLGADACSASRCNLSTGVIADDARGTVTVRLGQPDPEFLYKLALPAAYPVPRGVSMTKPSRLGVPGTGPYMIQSYRHSRVVLVRNPHFREWSAAAQPDGYPDRIILDNSDAPGAQLTAVEHGKADVTQAPLPASRLNEVATYYAADVHIFSASTTFALFLNTSVPPFNKLAARQAFNYAIDRSKAIAAFGGAEGASVTCQIVPAGMNGYRPFCPYTRNPTGNGIWTGPDLAKARKLVTASGTRGEKVVVWTFELPPPLAAGRLAVATLRKLGYRASLRRVADENKYFTKVADSRTRAQAGFDAWGSDYPAASNFLTPFTCHAFQRANENNLNTSEICDDHIDQAVNRALVRQTTDVGAASSAAWHAVDRLVTINAPWVPLVNKRRVVVVSRRVRNLDANPQWGVLIDQIWVK